MNYQKTFHSRMAEAAELGTGDFELAELGRLEPRWNLPSWESILLEPEMRQKETVDYVL